MALLSMTALVRDLQAGSMPRHKTYLFNFFSPIVIILNSGFFVILIFGHRAINYFFTSLFGEVDVSISFYHVWSYGVAVATLALMVIGIAWCYWINLTYAEGKQFWRRLVMVGFIIRCRILLYAIIGVLLVGAFSNLYFTKKIEDFKHAIYPVRDKVFAVNRPKSRRASIVQMFHASGASGFLPLLPSKFKTFFTQLCEIILMLYQLLSLLPLVLMSMHYVLVAYFLKKYFSVKKAPRAKSF